LPWFEGNTLYWNFLKNTSISKEIEISREMITECVLKSYKEIIYPNTTTLVMWKEGKQMNIHKDNGYENEEHILGMREFTSVMYLNDNFEGGETIILKENSNEIEYKCKPQKGSVLIFKSDESCLHGVNKIEKGERLVLSMWFTKNVKYLEN
jgi:predicted 2-oxoglutarate/Fe(II)-dependent dioxygenase YbiX